MPARLTLYIDQGTDFGITINLDETDGTPLATANVEFFSSARKVFSSESQFSFDVIQANGDGSMSIGLSSDVSANIKPGKYEYDVLMRAENNAVFKLIEGLVFVLPTMTRLGANT